MSAAFTPEPDDRDSRSVPEHAAGAEVPAAAPAHGGPDPSGSGCLTERDRRILDDIAGHETGSDPKFAARLTSTSRPVSRATEVLIQVAAVFAVVVVLLPGQWRLTALMVALFLLGPAFVAWYGYRAGSEAGPESGGTPGPF